MHQKCVPREGHVNGALYCGPYNTLGLRNGSRRNGSHSTARSISMTSVAAWTSAVTYRGGPPASYAGQVLYQLREMCHWDRSATGTKGGIRRAPVRNPNYF